MDGNQFEIGTEVEPANAQRVIDEINNQINQMMVVLPTDAEMQTAKNNIRSGKYILMDSSAATSYQLLNEEFYGQPETSEYLAAVDQVTARQVQEVAQKIFVGSNRYMVIGHG